MTDPGQASFATAVEMLEKRKREKEVDDDDTNDDGHAEQERKRELSEGDDDEDDATIAQLDGCLLYTSPSPRDGLLSRMPSSA